MNAEAFGGYCSLLVEMWFDPAGSLPDDDIELAQLARMTPSAWLMHGDQIRSITDLSSSDGRLRSEIVDAALQRADRLSRAGSVAVEARKAKQSSVDHRPIIDRSSTDHRQQKSSESTDHRPIIDDINSRSSKEKVKVKEKENYNSSSCPEEARSKTPKALQKGDQKNESTWVQFDSIYPRPSNGRKLERAQARLTWDILASAGENLDAVIEGAKKYRVWVDTLSKREYVAMMTTWLNQRRWEESYLIDSDSTEGKLASEKSRAEDREQRSAYQASRQAEYDKAVEQIAADHASSAVFIHEWKRATEASLAKRKRMGIAGPIALSEKLLSDPAAAREDQIRVWKELNSDKIIDFWEWDKANKGAE
jgi:hypothetical protein